MIRFQLIELTSANQMLMKFRTLLDTDISKKHGCWVTPDVDLNFTIEEACYAELMNSTDRRHGSATEDLSLRKRGQLFARRYCDPPLTNIDRDQGKVR